MRLFFLVLLQALLFLPIPSLAAGPGKTPIPERGGKTTLTEARRAGVIRSYGRLPLYFIRNDGQADSRVSFYERGAGHATFFTDEGLVLALTKGATAEKKAGAHGSAADVLKDSKDNDNKAAAEAVTLSFKGAKRGRARITASEPRPGRVNYFVGSDRSKWRSDIPTFGALTYRDVYKNIDIKFYGSSRSLEHDVIVRPGGDFSKVVFAYRGIEGLRVTETGDLEVSLKRGRIIEEKPVIYQEIDGRRVPVQGAYKLLGEKDGAFTYGFDVASYDHTKDLVIDPVLVYSTYLGGSMDDNGYAIAVDSAGAAYVTGATLSIDFPQVHPIQGVYGGVWNAFITKIDPSGSALVYSTHLGGSSDDFGNAITVDSAGAVYVTGTTASADFPLAAPIQWASGGQVDGFVTKLNAAGSALLYSTYLGGSGDDIAKGITVESSAAAFVTGFTSSPADFPLVSPLQATFGGGLYDAFITEINSAGTAIVYSTFLGGSGDDYGEAIAADSSGAVYVFGKTLSLDFPLAIPIQWYAGGLGDAFVTKVNPAGSALVYSTYLGGNDQESARAIAVDSSGAAYVTGYTASRDFPLKSPLQGAHGGGMYDAFATKISAPGTALVYSTYLGGGGDDFGEGIAVDNTGAAYVAGSSRAAGFPLVNPIQGTFGGGEDSFVSKIGPAGSALVYSTYLGGAAIDYSISIAVDSTGAAYITGVTFSSDYPLMNALQTGLSGFSDAVITKISGTPPPVITLAVTPDTGSVALGGTLGYTVTAANTTANTQCFDYWEDVTLPNGSRYPPIDELFGPIHTCLAAGASRVVHLTHGVPRAAPLGGYVFNLFAGSFPPPKTVTDEAHFNFSVTALGPLKKHPETSWRLIENGFRE